MAMKKLYSNSWAAPLTTEQRWAVYEKSLSSRSWEKCASWAVKEFGLPKMPSHAAWFKWCKGMRERENAWRVEQAMQTKKTVEELAKVEGFTDREAIDELVRQAVSCAVDLKDYKSACALVQAATSLRTSGAEQRKIEMLEAKCAAMQKKEDEAKAAMAKKLTPEERAKKIREIFNWSE